MRISKKIFYSIFIIVIISFVLITTLNKTNYKFGEELINIDNLSIFEDSKDKVIYFARDTCPSCKEIKPLLSETFKDSDKEIYYFDTDKWRNNKEFDRILKYYSVESVPYFVKLKNNRVTNKFNPEDIGFENKEILHNELNEFLK